MKVNLCLDSVLNFLQIIAIIVGGVWIVYNFDFLQRNKLQHVNTELIIKKADYSVEGAEGLFYVEYGLNIENESQEVLDIAGAHIIFFGHVVERKEDFLPEFTQVVSPGIVFSQSDFIIQSNKVEPLELGQAVHLSGYRLAPREKASESSIYFLLPRKISEKIDSIGAYLTVYAKKPCRRTYFFFTTCHEQNYSLQISRREKPGEECDRRYSRKAPNPAIGAMNCVRVVKLKKIAGEERDSKTLLYTTSSRFLVPKS